MKVKIISNEQGKCPYCNSHNIEYSSADFEENMVYYQCECEECKRYFEEWYELKFAGHNGGRNGNYLVDDVINKEIEY